MSRGAARRRGFALTDCAGWHLPPQDRPSIRRSTMGLRILTLAATLFAGMISAATAETLKVAVPQRGFWDSEFIEFAEKLGSFKKVGLDIEIFWTSGGSETLQTVMTGSADIAMSNGTLGVVAA